MARLTPAELKAKLEALGVHADSSDRVQAAAKEMTERDEEIGGPEAVPATVVARLVTLLAKPPQDLRLDELKAVTGYLLGAVIASADLVAIRARLAELETHSRSPRRNKAFLEALLERDSRIGHDDDETTSRLNTLLDAPPATVNADKLIRLTDRWRTAT